MALIRPLALAHHRRFTHLDNGDEAIIFSAPEARYVSMRISLSDLMWIPIVSDLLSTLLSSFFSLSLSFIWAWRKRVAFEIVFVLLEI